MGIYSFKDRTPRVSQSAYIDPQARIIGDVRVGDNSVVMFGSIVRGDEAPVTIGDNVVILENCIIEAPEGKPVVVDSWSLISHGAIVHGACIGSRALIGVGSIVLDGAVVEEEAIVAAGAVVPPGTVVKRRMLVAGIPAKPLREVRDSEVDKILFEVKRVIEKSKHYREAVD